MLPPQHPEFFLVLSFAYFPPSYPAGAENYPGSGSRGEASRQAERAGILARASAGRMGRNGISGVSVRAPPGSAAMDQMIPDKMVKTRQLPELQRN